MRVYSDALLPVPAPLIRLHGDDLEACTRAGEYWDGADRRAIALEARAARCAAGFSSAGSDETPPAGRLSDTVRAWVHDVAARPQELDDKRIEPVLAEIGDAACVEVVGVVSRIVNHDVFARGIGVPSVSLPEASAGKPAGRRPEKAIDEGAFVPSIPCGRRGGDEGRAIYGDAMQPFIYRALSLAPDEARRNMALGDAQYLPLEFFFDFSYSHCPGLSRSQVELVAGRVSALNECFY